MFLNLCIGTVIIALTVVFHAIMLDIILRHTARIHHGFFKNSRHFRKSLLLAAVVLAVFCVLIVEMWLWAGLYLVLGALPDLESALYFSTTSFTTVGFGDIALDKAHRILGSIEAANGFLLFGWSTAFIFEIVSQLYRKEGDNIGR